MPRAAGAAYADGMARALPRSKPADQHVDPAAILRFLDAVDDHRNIEMHSLMLLRRGQVIAEGWWAPYSAAGRTCCTR